MELMVHKLIEYLKLNYSEIEILDYNLNTILINKFGFGSEIIENMEKEFNINLDFYYEFDDCDFEMVIIKIK